jgi:hypothetical protein
MEVPPWLQITPSSYLNAMEAGAHIGLQRQQMAAAEREAQMRDAISQRELQQRAMQEQASLGLQRNSLMQSGQEAAGRLALGNREADNSAAAALMNNSMRGQELERQTAQQEATRALEEARLNQSGDLGEQRLDAIRQRNEDLNKYNTDRNQNRSDWLDLREKQLQRNPGYLNFVKVTEKDGNETKTRWVSKDEYDAQNSAPAPDYAASALKPTGDFYGNKFFNGQQPPVTLGEQPATSPAATSLDGKTVVSKKTPPTAAIAKLLTHPELAAQFDEWYGEGSSANYLK